MGARLLRRARAPTRPSSSRRRPRPPWPSPTSTTRPPSGKARAPPRTPSARTAACATTTRACASASRATRTTTARCRTPSTRKHLARVSGGGELVESTGDFAVQGFLCTLGSRDRALLYLPVVGECTLLVLHEAPFVNAGKVRE